MTSDLKLIRIRTVDDHPLLRQGIAALVNGESDMKLVAEASNGKEAIEKFRLHRPDITLMDLQMPDLNGIEAITRIRSEFPDARILLLGQPRRPRPRRLSWAFSLHRDFGVNPLIDSHGQSMHWVRRQGRALAEIRHVTISVCKNKKGRKLNGL